MRTMQITNISDRQRPQPAFAADFSFGQFCRAAILLGPEDAEKMGFGMTRSERVIKRTFDIVVSVAALIVLSPLFLVIALGIRLSSPGPVIFTQERIGRHGRPFTILKFRTMCCDAPAVFYDDGQTKVDKNDSRVFPFGRLLRYGLDELPQLVNVLRGEMSLIGPRPDEPCHIKHYRTGWFRKLDIRPGITGLPQVYGRRELPWPDRVALDVAYTRGYRLKIDFAIFLRTAGAIIFDKTSSDQGL